MLKTMGNKEYYQPYSIVLNAFHGVYVVVSKVTWIQRSETTIPNIISFNVAQQGT